VKDRHWPDVERWAEFTVRGSKSNERERKNYTITVAVSNCMMMQRSKQEIGNM